MSVAAKGVPRLVTGAIQLCTNPKLVTPPRITNIFSKTTKAQSSLVDNYTASIPKLLTTTADDVVVASNKATSQKKSIFKRIRDFFKSTKKKTSTTAQASKKASTSKALSKKTKASLTTKNLSSVQRGIERTHAWLKMVGDSYDKALALIKLTHKRQQARVHSQIRSRFEMQKFLKAHSKAKLIDAVKSLKKLIADNAGIKKIRNAMAHVKDCMFTAKLESEYYDKAKILADSIKYA